VLIAWKVSLLLPLFCLYVYCLHQSYLFFVCLTHPYSPQNISSQHGYWQLEQYNGEKYDGLILNRYFLSSHYIVLYFVSEQRVDGQKLEGGRVQELLFWKRKKTLMIFPHQIGELEFRSLYRLLKFQNQAIFPAKVLE